MESGDIWGISLTLREQTQMSVITPGFERSTAVLNESRDFTTMIDSDGMLSFPRRQE